MLTIGIGVCLHLAIFPDRLHTIVPVHLCPTTIVVLFTAKTEHLRAGRCIPDSRDGLGIIDVDDVLIAAHVAVIDVQRLFIEEESGGIHGAVVKVNRDVMFSCTEIRVNIDYLSTCIKGAGIKCHDRGAIRPDRIISTWSIEDRIDKLCTLITPVEGLAVDDTVLYDCVINTSKTVIITGSTLELHLFKLDIICSIETVVTIFSFRLICFIANFPCSLICSLPHKGQVFSLGATNAGDTVQCIIALAKLDGIPALCRSHSNLQGRIGRSRSCSLPHARRVRHPQKPAWEASEASSPLPAGPPKTGFDFSVSTFFIPFITICIFATDSPQGTLQIPTALSPPL